MALMMGLWQYLAKVPASNDAASPPRPVADAPRAPSKRTDPSSLRLFQTPGQSPIARGPIESGWTQSLEGRWTQLEQLARKHSDAQRTAAALLMQQGRFEEATTAFDRLLLRDADNPVLLTGKGLALAGLNRHEDAQVLLDSALRLDPNNPAARFNAAVGLMRCGEREQAARAFEQLLAVHPGHAKAMFNLAILHQAAGRDSQALEVWRELTAGFVDPAVDPSSVPARASGASISPRMRADAWSHRGGLALQHKDAVEAEMCFLKVVELDPQDAEGWCNVGIARAEQVRRSDAITALQIALQLDPDLVPALNQAAYIHAANYRDVGRVEDGRAVSEYCQRSLRVNRDQPNIRELLQAAAHFQQQEHEAAEPAP